MPELSTLSGIAFIVLGGSLLLGVLIFIHEAGHYLVAKLLGIRVEVFSLGFGPRVSGFTRGGTEYRLSAIPLGGYVKMLGENPDEALRGSREEFLSRSKFERFLVLVMGASLNIVLAVALTAGIYMHGVSRPQFETEPPVVGFLDPNGAAAEAGIRAGDRILKIADREVKTWQDMQIQVALNPNKELPFRIARGEEVVMLPVKVRERPVEPIGMIGIGPLTRLSISAVTPGGSADRAGLRPGDEIVSVEGREILLGGELKSFVEMFSSRAGETVSLRVLRDGSELDVTMSPEEQEKGGSLSFNVGYPMREVQFGFTAAVSRSLQDNWGQSGLLLVSLKKLVTSEMSPRTLSGPISIFKMAGASLQLGWTPFFSIMALMSLQLGIINLLPIPILDGGHIFIIFIEGLIRRDLSVRIKERVMQFGFILLLLIMGGVISMDLYKNLFVQ